MQQTTIEITEPSLRRLLKSYRAAVKAGAESFTHEGAEFLTMYAYYMLFYYCPKVGINFNETRP